MQAEIWGCLHKYLGAPQLKKITDLSCLKGNDYDIILNMERESFQITFQGHGARPPGTSRRGDYVVTASD